MGQFGNDTVTCQRRGDLLEYWPILSIDVPKYLDFFCGWFFASQMDSVLDADSLMENGQVPKVFMWKWAHSEVDCFSTKNSGSIGNFER